MVTDGWWWTRAVLDAQLQALVSRGKLRDGCKIAVFAATIDASGDSATMQLSLNGVKLASSAAPAGFIRPAVLRRGLALRGLSTEGGAVFGVRVKVIFVTGDMAAVTISKAGGGREQQRQQQQRQSFGGFPSTTLFRSQARLLSTTSRR
jgi:hypothetical protein